MLKHLELEGKESLSRARFATPPFLVVSFPALTSLPHRSLSNPDPLASSNIGLPATEAVAPSGGAS